MFNSLLQKRTRNNFAHKTKLKLFLHPFKSIESHPLKIEPHLFSTNVANELNIPIDFALGALS